MRRKPAPLIVVETIPAKKNIDAQVASVYINTLSRCLNESNLNSEQKKIVIDELISNFKD